MKKHKNKTDFLYVGWLDGISDPELFEAMSNRDDIEHVWFIPIWSNNVVSQYNDNALLRSRYQYEKLQAIDLKPLLQDMISNGSVAVDMNTLQSYLASKSTKDTTLIDPESYDGVLSIKVPDSIVAHYFETAFPKAWHINRMLPHYQIGDKSSLVWLKEAFENERQSKKFASNASAYGDALELFTPASLVYSREQAEQFMQEHHLKEAILKDRHGIVGRNIFKLFYRENRLWVRHEHIPAYTHQHGSKEAVWKHARLEIPFDELQHYLEEGLDLNEELHTDARISGLYKDGDEKFQRIDFADGPQGKPKYAELLMLKSLKKIMDSFRMRLSEGMIMQPCLDVSKGDLRVIIAGGQVVGAFKRMPEVDENGNMSQIANEAGGGKPHVPYFAKGWQETTVNKADLGYADMIRLTALAQMLQREPYHQHWLMLDMLADDKGRRFITEINAARSNSLGYVCNTNEPYDFSVPRKHIASQAAQALMDAFHAERSLEPAGISR